MSGGGKRNVCVSCGAPRDMSISLAMCYECYLLYKHTDNQNRYHGLNGVRARSFRQKYTELGLEPGKVWAKVLR